MAWEIWARYGQTHKIRHMGMSQLPVEVWIRQDGRDLANEIRVRYGLDVVVTMAPGPTTCPNLPTSAGPGFRGTVRPTRLTVPSGADLRGAEITLSNPTNAAIEYVGGEFGIGMLAARRTRTALGVYDGVLTRAGMYATVEPGRKLSMPMVVGTTGCGRGAQAGVPPGVYDLYVTFGNEPREWATGPFPITVAP